jgi:light-regulated signal transduction histidine kinase (bacteriophytochrome)
MISISVENMRAIIDSLLILTNINSEVLRFEEVDLNAVVTSSMSDQQTRIEETKAHIELGRMPKVSGDAIELQLLFSNLLSNALKFSVADPVISIEAIVLPDSAKQELALNPEKTFYRIDMRDNGIGFEQDHAEIIFGAFQRLNAKSEYKGFGIGLAICRKIVERHNGLIFAHSVVGKGSTFSIIVPR